MASVMTNFQRNMQLGLRRGIEIGGFFAAGAVVSVLVSGPKVLDQYRISLVGLLAYDLTGGALTGLIVGSLLPFASRSSIWAALIGFISMLPASLVGMLIVTPSDEWGSIVPAGFLVAAALLGGLGGPLLRSFYAGETTTNWRFVAIVASTGAVLALLMYFAGWW